MSASGNRPRVYEGLSPNPSLSASRVCSREDGSGPKSGPWDRRGLVQRRGVGVSGQETDVGDGGMMFVEGTV